MATLEINKIQAKLNSPVKITLRANSTSGYEWNPIFNSSALKLVKKNRIANLRTFGGAAEIVYNFQPLSYGEHKIVFNLQRPWENKPIEEKHYLIQVE